MATSVIQNAKGKKKECSLKSRKEKKREEGVNDEPGPALVLTVTPRPFISCRTRAKRARSIAKATSVTSAARKETNEATSMTVTCAENASNNATKLTAVAVIYTREIR